MKRISIEKAYGFNRKQSIRKNQERIAYSQEMVWRQSLIKYYFTAIVGFFLALFCEIAIYILPNWNKTKKSQDMQ